MSNTRDGQLRVLTARMTGVFDVKWNAGITAGEAFEQSRASLVRRLESDAELARSMDFRHFARSYLHHSVTESTMRQPPAGEG